jgi:hypothetical protein
VLFDGRIALGCMRGERLGHTLQATALVDEAYLRLVDARTGLVPEILPGGQRDDTSEGSPPSLMVVINWAEELEQRVAAP